MKITALLAHVQSFVCIQLENMSSRIDMQTHAGSSSTRP